ncbi:hypothetical protein [Thauera linaloolentis]|uniref:Uncharacterized protein n=1 Tax=Thauera linaloolentis (strain DSM 12138 / JCM 21573 / CCUG 41526 / CIP 105981 / IAM 15112 / NBRC 102519 / 47Lol) TaxID=1123367 RepID=N6Z802_THAL4|nr:hypothetical protein [Thauera linaloolentis]ENO90438.1 hypothetical protein C666_01000 [Thauera linaloolentis 47Lol = DSM 12138]MCM8566299.1 hypothetical protein [Thauera linaloolentis]
MHKAILAFSLLAPLAAHANYAECILDRMPGVQNDAAAYAAHQVCLSDFPGGLQAVKQGSGRGFFGFDSGAECTLKKAGDTRSQRGAAMISASCRKLYDEPTPDWEKGVITPPPMQR